MFFGQASLGLPIAAAILVPGPGWMRVVYFFATYAVSFELMAIVAREHVDVHDSPRAKSPNRRERALRMLLVVVRFRDLYGDLFRAITGR